MLQRLTSTFVTATLIVLASISHTEARDSFAADNSLSQKKLAFTQNNGQWSNNVLFRAGSGDAILWVTKEGVAYQFARHIAGHSREGGNPGSVGRTFLSDPGQAGMPILLDDRYEEDSIEQLALTAKFVGANPNVEIRGEGLLEYKCNYFLGNDPAKWRTNVPSYSAILLKGVYPGIDLRYSDAGNGQPEYKFVLAPGTDASQIKVEYEGVLGTSVDSDGRVILRTAWGDLVGAVQAPIVGKGAASGGVKRLLGQVVGDWSNGVAKQALDVSSTGIFYSTLLGGSAREEGYGIAVDGSGCAYVVGYTQSTDYPTQSPYQTDQASYDVMVTKLSAGGRTPIYSTYLGGSDNDRGRGIAIDNSDHAYLVGFTASSDFPTKHSFQTDQSGYDAFVTKLATSGDSLIYSTYIGGSDDDYGTAIAVDDTGSAYVTGYTYSPDFPTQSPYQTRQANGDVFVTRLSVSGNTLIYSTYLGGAGSEWGNAIAIDDSGSAYVTGYTSSVNYPTQNPFQYGPAHVYDVFVTKLAAAGNSLVYSTYLGGTDSDVGEGIAVDGSGQAYVTGYTYSTDFPLQGAYQTDQSGQDAFVTKFNAAGNGLIYSTYLGGNSADYGYDIAVDDDGAAYVTGVTSSANFPTQDPVQTTQGNADAFVTKLNQSGSGVLLSTYLGGNDTDEGIDIAVNNAGEIYVTGMTYSTNFPVTYPCQADLGGCDVFVTKFGKGCLDEDHDMVCDSSDNCPGKYNPCQEDYDQDRIGDACDACNNFKPVVTISQADTLVRCGKVYDYFPKITDPDDNVHAITYLQYPSWCSVRNDSLVGLAPVTPFSELVKIQVSDVCNVDTMSFQVTAYLCGDVNADLSVDISDVVYLIAYIFSGGPAPMPLMAGDANCDLTIDISDAVFLIAYIFSGGPAPCAGC